VSVTVNGVDNAPTQYGGNGDSTLIGTAGDEMLVGGNGKDLLIGGAGADTLIGGNGADTLLGGAGRDRLDGGNGADVLDGGAGDDTLTGGNGPDRFVFQGASGHDVVTDFERGDTLQFDHAVFANYADVMNHAHQVGMDVVITDAAGDSVTLLGVQLASLRASDFLFA